MGTVGNSRDDGSEFSETFAKTNPWRGTVSIGTLPTGLKSVPRARQQSQPITLRRRLT